MLSCLLNSMNSVKTFMENSMRLYLLLEQEITQFMIESCVRVDVFVYKEDKVCQGSTIE